MRRDANYAGHTIAMALNCASVQLFSYSAVGRHHPLDIDGVDPAHSVTLHIVIKVPFRILH